MRVISINNSVNFGKVFAVAGTKNKIKQLKDTLTEQGRKLVVMPATDLYAGKYGSGLCANAANSGKEVAFFVTGKDIKKVEFMANGWSSINGISHHISEFVDIENVADSAKTMTKAWYV